MDQIAAKFLRHGAEVLAIPFEKYIKFINKVVDLPRGV